MSEPLTILGISLCLPRNSFREAKCRNLCFYHFMVIIGRYPAFYGRLPVQTAVQTVDNSPFAQPPRRIMVNKPLWRSGKTGNFIAHVSPCASRPFPPEKIIKSGTAKAVPPGVLCHSSVIPACSQMRMVSASQMPACTSPMWQAPIMSMHRRLCPMPPPMVCGSWPASSIR